MADNAKSDLKRELGDDLDLADLNLRDLDPRTVVRDTLMDVQDTQPRAVKEPRILRPGEVPPFDTEAT